MNELNDFLIEYKKVEKEIQKDFFKKIKKASNNSNFLSIVSSAKNYFENGKKIRPYIMWLIYKANGGQNDQLIYKFGFFLELIHAFGLIHDDIIDNSNLRRNLPTAHYQIIKTTKISDLNYAKNQAILVGDIVFAHLNILLLEEKMDSKIIKEFQKLYYEVLIGQVLDLHISKKPNTTLKQIHEKNYLKTISYSFLRPANIAMLLANKKIDSVNAKQYQALMQKLGCIYQAQDDLLDFSLDSKKAILTDFQNGIPTLFNYQIKKATDPEIKKIYKDFFGKKIPTKMQKNVINKILESKTYQKYKKEIKKSLGELKKMPKASDLMFLINYLENRKY